MDPGVRIGGALVAAWLGGCVQTLSQPFTNGSFEMPALAPGSSVPLNPSTNFLTGWNIGGSGGNVELVNGVDDGLLPWDGSQWIAFKGGGNPAGGSLSQTFSTVVNQHYVLSLELIKAGAGPTDAEQLTATAFATNGALLMSNSFIPSSNVWEHFEVGFTALTGTTTLSLDDTSPVTQGVDLGLDDVIVQSTNSSPPTVLLSPASQTAVAGESVTFTIVSGGGESAIQWFEVTPFQTNAITGAVQSSLTVAAGYETAARYFARLSNLDGSTDTAPALLTILDMPFTNGGFEDLYGPAPPDGGILNPYRA